MGYKGDGDEVLSHPFFASLDIKGLYNKTVVPPFKPESSENSFEFFNVK